MDIDEAHHPLRRRGKPRGIFTMPSHLCFDDSAHLRRLFQDDSFYNRHTQIPEKYRHDFLYSRFRRGRSVTAMVKILDEEQFRNSAIVLAVAVERNNQQRTDDSAQIERDCHNESAMEVVREGCCLDSENSNISQQNSSGNDDYRGQNRDREWTCSTTSSCEAIMGNLQINTGEDDAEIYGNKSTSVHSDNNFSKFAGSSLGCKQMSLNLFHRFIPNSTFTPSRTDGYYQVRTDSFDFSRSIKELAQESCMQSFKSPVNEKLCSECRETNATFLDDEWNIPLHGKELFYRNYGNHKVKEPFTSRKRHLSTSADSKSKRRRCI